MLLEYFGDEGELPQLAMMLELQPHAPSPFSKRSGFQLGLGTKARLQLGALDGRFGAGAKDGFTSHIDSPLCIAVRLARLCKRGNSDSHSLACASG